MAEQRYRVRAIKRRSGEVIKGFATWDGLASLLTVTTDEGEQRYVSHLDDLTLTPAETEPSTVGLIVLEVTTFDEVMLAGVVEALKQDHRVLTVKEISS